MDSNGPGPDGLNFGPKIQLRHKLKLIISDNIFWSFKIENGQ